MSSRCLRINWDEWPLWMEGILERWKSLLPRRSSAELYALIPAVAVTIRWIATVSNCWYIPITLCWLWFWSLNQVPWQVPVRPASSIINFRQEPGFSLILVYLFSYAGKKSGPAQICQFQSARRLWFPSWARVLRIDSLASSLEASVLPQSQGRTSSLRNRVHLIRAYFSIPQNKWCWYAFFWRR